MVADCYVLTTKSSAVFPINLPECNGVMVKKGDLIITNQPLATDLKNKYTDSLNEPKPAALIGSKFLRSGHFEIRQYRLVISGVKRIEILDENELVLKSESMEDYKTPRTLKEAMDNRSMKNPKAAEKTRVKRAYKKKVKKKLTIEE